MGECACTPRWVELFERRCVFLQPSLETDPERNTVLCTQSWVCIPAPSAPEGPGHLVGETLLHGPWCPPCGVVRAALTLPAHGEHSLSVAMVCTVVCLTHLQVRKQGRQPAPRPRDKDTVDIETKPAEPSSKPRVFFSHSALACTDVNMHRCHTHTPMHRCPPHMHIPHGWA